MTAPDEPRPQGEDADDARPDRGRDGSARSSDAARRRRRAQVFGDPLPEATRDERGDGWGEREDRAEPADEWLRRQVPPHHG